MSSTSETTELEAINTILASVGELPVTSLASSDPTVTVAQNTLNEVSRAVQGLGWFWNSETDVELTAAADAIVIASNVLRIDVARKGPNAANYIQKYNSGVKQLYDKENKTFTISTGSVIKADIVYLYDFAAVPQAARRFIMLKAARLFAGRFLNDRGRLQAASVEELDAWRALKREEDETGDFNILTQPPGFNAVNRTSPFDRIGD